MAANDMIKFLPRLLYHQWTVNIPVPEKSFQGQTVIVTGGSNGLGLEAARHITRLQAEKVILAVRNIKKGESAKASIEESTGVKGVIEVWELDLAKHESVKQFAEKAKQLPRLDVLLLNAGINESKWSVAEGDEQTITVNVISTFLLLLLLIPTLKESARKFNIAPRATVVSSELHAMSNVPERNDPSGSIFGTLRDEKKAKMAERYTLSKLLEIFVVRQIIQDHGKDYPVVINLVNPGFCRSGLISESVPKAVSATMYTVLGARTTEFGSRTLVNAANGGPETNGQYLSNGKVAHPSSFVVSSEGQKTQKRVWEELQARLEEIEPGCTQNF